MQPFITHNTNSEDGKSIQSYALPDTGKVVIDFNGWIGDSDYQEWSIEDARAIATLLALAIADAELES